MIANNIINATGLVIWQLFRDLALFPLWWYSIGLYKCLKWCLGYCFDWWRALALGVWIKNLFVPMYGQRDIAGRLISFFMRLFQIIVRMIAFVLLLSISIVILLIWLSAPLVIIWQLLYQLGIVYG